MHLLAGLMDTDGHQCSTPFGDIDECTRAFPKPEVTPRGCAQRLSATLMNALCGWLIACRRRAGAQRLSATLMNALVIAFASPATIVAVLNAFRRH